MVEYEIFFKKSVWKDFKIILGCIDSLKTDPRQPGCIKLSGQERYRIRYGRYRVIYSIQDEELTIWVVQVGLSKNVYK